MKPEQIAAQPYTCKPLLADRESAISCLQRLAKIGFRAVQVSPKMPFDDAETKRICDDLGLTICATHAGHHEVVNDTQRVMDRLSLFGARYTATGPGDAKAAMASADFVKGLAANLNTAAQIMANNGFGLAYHNHAFELIRFGKQSMLEIIYEQAPDLLAEIDLYWLQAGGVNPLSWCEKLSGRTKFAHIKDYSMNDNYEPNFAPIGAGGLEWESIIPVLEQGGCEWFIIEQDNCYGRDPVDCLDESYSYLTTNFCET